MRCLHREKVVLIHSAWVALAEGEEAEVVVVGLVDSAGLVVYLVDPEDEVALEVAALEVVEGLEAEGEGVGLGVATREP